MKDVMKDVMNHEAECCECCALTVEKLICKIACLAEAVGELQAKLDAVCCQPVEDK